MPDNLETELQADLDLLSEFWVEEWLTDVAPVEEGTEEGTGLDYYYNIMLPELEAKAFTEAEKIDFIVKILSA